MNPYRRNFIAMIRILTVAAVAAMIAAPASAQTARINLSGKTSDQIQADIAKAAKKVCTKAVVGATFPREMYASCFKFAVNDAKARLGAQTQMAVSN
ncbi:hypothetical protein [Phenylobacterium sp.]|uniref:hypothetical protein n=1 Tax=Phenylobacterium sp. TaxID=1871053 RepID=UPI0025F96E5E|nr:hypothetical protein [Phenylobacterium sp.]